MNYDDKIADDEWEWYIGQIFARLMQHTKKATVKTVVEIAPGFRYKIAYALKNINFNGIIYIIDTNAEVLEYVSEKYKSLLPDAKIICINKNFEDSFDDIPNEFDILLSNHCIDDMIISEYMQNYYNKNLGNVDFKDLLTKAWVELGKNRTMVKIISDKVYTMFEKFFKNKKIQTIIISQYKSNLYFKDKFTEMDEITEKCFYRIKELVKMNDNFINQVLDFFPFGNDERYMGKYLLENTQNAKNWIVGTYKD